MRYVAIVLGSMAITWLVLMALAQAFKIKAVQEAYVIGPFNQPLEYWCSKANTEYLITQQSMALHVKPDGMPATCMPAY